MSDDRVIAYIKTQHAKGFSLEKIKAVLIAQGWDEKIVADACIQAIPKAPVVSQKSKKSFIIQPKVLLLISIILPIIIVLGVIGLLVIKNQQGIGLFQSEILDCEEDMDCFIESVELCRPTKAVHYSSYDMSIVGVTQVMTTYFELQKEEDRCIFYFKTLSIDLIFPDDTPQETIDAQNAKYNELEGHEAKCVLEKEVLTNLLRSWKDGSFTTYDLTSNQCEGTFFDQDS